MPYDISQLNDMLIPELIDIADELKIQNARSLDKQALVYKILDQQAINMQPAEDEPKKKRGRKPKEEAAETISAANESADAGDKKRRVRKPREDFAPDALPEPSAPLDRPASLRNDHV